MAHEGGDGQIDYTINLDAKEMIEGLTSIKEQIAEIGEAKSLLGLASHLTEAAALVGTLGAAFLAIKTSVETVLDAEKIKKVQVQFEALAASAGLMGDELKEKLATAGKGLAEENELLKASNKALVELGVNANKLPETLELARKVTAVFGGDMVTRFEEINQAIATGNERILRHIGLKTDFVKAYKDYAESIGSTVGRLSEESKQQARLQAVLDAGASKFKGVNDSIIKANTTWQQLKVTLEEIKEVAILAFEKVAGPTVRAALEDLTYRLKQVKTWFTAAFGEGTEQAAAKTDILKGKLKSLYGDITTLQAKIKIAQDPYVIQYYNTQLDIAKKKYNDIQKQLTNVTAEEKKLKETREESQKALLESSKVETSAEDLKKKAVEQRKFQADLLRLHEETLKAQEAATSSYAEKERLFTQEMLIEKEKYALKVKEISQSDTLTQSEKNAQLAELEEQHLAHVDQMNEQALQKKRDRVRNEIETTQSSAEFEAAINEQRTIAEEQRQLQLQQIKENIDLTEQQREAQKVEIERQYQDEITRINENSYKQRDAMIQRSVYASNNAAAQFAAGFASASKKAANDLSNFGAQGAKMANMLSHNLSNMFIQMGEGSKKGSEVMRGAMFNLLADISQAYGEMALEMGLVPPNPIYLAAGGALLALSGYLRSQAHGGGGGMSFSGAGGAGGGGAEMGGTVGIGSTAATASTLTEQQKTAKSVHLEIHGNIFDSDQTKQRIAQLVRDSIDSTDFSVARIGGGV